MSQPKLVAKPARETFRECIQRELSAFEHREKAFRARERTERLQELMGAGAPPSDGDVSR